MAVVAVYWVVSLVVGLVNQAWVSVAISALLVLAGASCFTRRYRRRER